MGLLTSERQLSRGVSPQIKRFEFLPNCLLCLSDKTSHVPRRLRASQASDVPEKSGFPPRTFKRDTCSKHCRQRPSTVTSSRHPDNIIVSPITHISRKGVPYRLIPILRTKKVSILALEKLHCQDVSSYRHRRTRTVIRISGETVKKKVCHQVAVIDVAEVKSPSYNISHIIAEILPWTMIVMGEVYLLGLIRR